MAKELLKTLKGLLMKQIFFSDFSLCILVIVYSMYTYVFDIFDRTPYLGIFGPKNSGKTSLGDFLEGVCFKGTQTSDITSAALYRFVDRERGTLIIDEGLHSEARFDRLNRILRSGYRRGGRVICCEPGGSFATFSTFCPKTIMDKTEPSDPALSSRIISIRMARSPIPLERPLDSDAKIEFQKVRELITKFWEENRQALLEHYKSSQRFDEFINRDAELWTPLLTVSTFLDSLLKSSYFFEKMLLLARKLNDSKKRDELEENPELQILEGTQAFIEDPNTNKLQGNLYAAFQIRDFIKRRWDLSGLSTKKVVQTLKLYQVCGKRQRPRSSLSSPSQPACYPIDKQKLDETLKEYFDGGVK